MITPDTPEKTFKIKGGGKQFSYIKLKNLVRSLRGINIRYEKKIEDLQNKIRQMNSKLEEHNESECNSDFVSELLLKACKHVN